MILVLLLFLCAPLFSAEIILGVPPYLYHDAVLGDINFHGDASVCTTYPAAVTSTYGVAYDTAANFAANHVLAYRTGLTLNTTAGPTGGAGVDPCASIKGLVGGTTYVACPVLTSGGDTTDCTSTGNAGSRFTFTTPATPAIDPVPPTRADVSDFDTTYPADTPAIGGARDFTVSADCSNLTSQLAAAAASATGAGLTAAVTIPYTTTCTAGNLPVLPARASGQPWVVVRTSRESYLPSPGGRVSRSTYGSYMPVMNVNTSGNGFIGSGGGTTNAKIRFVGIRIIFDDGTAIAQAGNPNYSGAFLWKVTSTAVSWIIFDRCVFDGQGYPSRLFAATYIDGSSDFQYVAWIGCHFADIYNWRTWMGAMTATVSGSSGKKLDSTASFQVGRGDQICTVAPYSVTTTDSSAVNWVDYLDSSCGHVIKYSAGAAPTCVAVTCTLDATLTVPATGLQLNAYGFGGGTPMATSGGVWQGSGIYWWGNSGFGPGMMADSEKQSYAIIIDTDSPLAPDNKKLIIQNNLIDGAGILIFFEPIGVLNDLLIDRNDITETPGCFLSDPLGGSPFTCSTRYPFEFKNGHRVDITGNAVHGWFETNAVDGPWFSLKPDATLTAGAYTGDITITGNYVTGATSCFYISGMPNNLTTGWTYPKPIRRVNVSNNFCETNTWTASSYFSKWGTQPTEVNYGFNLIDQGAVDITIGHNTFYDGAGRGPGLGLTDALSHGVNYSGNIFAYQQSSYASFLGIFSWFGYEGNWSAGPIPAMGSFVHGTAGLEASIPALGASVGTSYGWDNVYLASCVDSAPANCTNATTGGALISSPPAGYPATTQWPTGSTLGARFNTIAYVDRTNSDFRLVSTSAYQSNGAAAKANDGQAYGFDQDSNQQARGLITGATISTIGTTTATVSARVPDSGGGCRIAYNTTGAPPWNTTAADTTASRQRSISLTGLASGTVYLAQVWCVNAAPTETIGFQTR